MIRRLVSRGHPGRTPQRCERTRSCTGDTARAQQHPVDRRGGRRKHRAGFRVRAVPSALQ